MVNINKYIKALLHPTGGHQGSHKAHQAGNQFQANFFHSIISHFLKLSKHTKLQKHMSNRNVIQTLSQVITNQKSTVHPTPDLHPNDMNSNNL